MERSGHSVLGILSFVAALVGAALFLLWLILAGLDADDILVGIAVLLQMFVSIIATGLGLPALFSQSRKRLFAILGVVLGSAEIIVSIGLMVAGMLALASGFVS